MGVAGSSAVFKSRVIHLTRKTVFVIVSVDLLTNYSNRNYASFKTMEGRHSFLSCESAESTVYNVASLGCCCFASSQLFSLGPAVLLQRCTILL
jgi:hypothetical protein